MSELNRNNLTASLITEDVYSAETVLMRSWRLGTDDLAELRQPCRLSLLDGYLQPSIQEDVELAMLLLILHDIYKFSS